MKTRKTTMALIPCLALAIGSAQGATITEDFEGGAPGWTAVNGGSGTYSIASNGNPNGAANLDWTGGNSTTAPGVFITNGTAGFLTSQAISGSFDFYLVEDGNYSFANFLIGDVANGLDGGSAGEYLSVDLRERTFGARANIYDSAGNKVFVGDGNNQHRIDTNQWINASFTWTPDVPGIGTGTFSFEWTYPAQPNRGPMTVTGYTFDAPVAYFGFGTGDSPVRYDNIEITGSDIPEPGSLALLGLGGLLVARRRRG